MRPLPAVLLVVLVALVAASPAQEKKPAASVSISGTVTLKGKAPARKRIRLDADPKCVQLHPEPMLSEDVLVDASNHLQWAFVYVKAGLGDAKRPDAPKAPVVLDQRGCRYEPRVMGVRVGQDFLIRCSDELLHIVHAIPRANQEWGFSQQEKGRERTKVFTAPEIMVPIKCDVHLWMKAWVGVLDHPWFAVTDASGRFEIKDLPPGKYTLEAWHEACKPVTLEVEVKEGAVAAVVADFELATGR